MIRKNLFFLFLFELFFHVFCQFEDINNSLYKDVDKEKLTNFFRLVRNAYRDTSETDDWKGRWFPDSPDEPIGRHRPPVTDDPNSLIADREQQHIDLISSFINSGCDDGKTNLTLDWDGHPEEYLCLLPPSVRFQPDSNLPAIEEKHPIPPLYKPTHICMNREINYPDPIVTFGPHRPAWPVYGEYKYVPPQRWLHNLEHGAIVMLYHPCAHPSQVNILRDLVKNCLFRHIITPSRRLTAERPLALLSWGYSLTMSEVSPTVVLNFIREHALHAPEQVQRDGFYNYKLVHKAQLVSDENDSRLCPYSF